MDAKLFIQRSIALLLALTLSGCGFTAPRGSEGFAALDSPGVFDTDVTMNLSIGPSLLRFAAMHMEDDPHTKALLEELDGVRVRTYEIARNPEKVAQRLDRMRSSLRDSQWTPVVEVREAGERTYMLVRENEAGICGITVLTSDGQEVVIVNVMGRLQPESFGEAMAALGVDAGDI